MEALALVHGIATLLLWAAVLGRASDRAAFEGLSRRDVLLYAGLSLLGVGISLFHFDAVTNHAFRAHEEAYYIGFQGEVPPHGWVPMETQRLLRMVFQGSGALFGHSMAVFVATAALTSCGSVGLVGAAVQLLARRRWIGLAVAALLATHPTLAYWRVHAFHVAAPHAMWAATLLLAAAVARRPSFLVLTAWFVTGALATGLRQDQALGVAATALVPLLHGDRGLIRRPGTWVPPFLLAAGLLVASNLADLQAGVAREDFHWGMRFLPLHLRVGRAYQPLTFVSALPLLFVGLWAAAKPRPRLRNEGVPDELRRLARTFALIAVLALFPDLLFMDFGQRHLLNTTAMGLALAVLAVEVLRALLPGRAGAVTAAGGILLAGIAAQSTVELADMGRRYSDSSMEVPAIPGVPRPTEPLAIAPGTCGIFAGESSVCDMWLHCWPLKDLRDPDNVGAFWDEHDGCILFMVDVSLDDVSGAVHEWWTMVTGIYGWEPVGVLPVPEEHANRDVEAYRLKARPRKSAAQQVKDADYRREDGH